jgi:hypothetical protein
VLVTVVLVTVVARVVSVRDERRFVIFLILQKMGKGAVKKVAAASSSESKDEKRRTRQAKAGIAFGVNKIHKAISKKRGGKVSTDAALTFAAGLDYLANFLLTRAAIVADRGITPGADGEKRPHRKLSSAHVQTVLTENPWITRFLAKGRVAGAAPVTNQVLEEEEDSSQ